MVDQRPALRDSVIVVEGTGDELHFLLTSSSTRKTFVVDDMARRLVALLDGTRSVPELDAELRDSTTYSPEHLRRVLDVLDGEAILAPRATQRAALTDRDRDRYARQLPLLEELARDETPERALGGDALQAALRRASVAVIGSGGLGSWILASLAAAGVGRLVVCDHDVVEASNLNRQIIFTESDLGRRKTVVAAERLRALEPTLAVDTVDQVITGVGDVAVLAERADLVVNCADRPSVSETSDWVAEACLARGVSHIVGGAYAYHVGSLGMTVLPGQTACWECARAAVGTNSTPVRSRSGPGPSLAMFSAVVANIVAWDATRALLGLRPATAGRLGELDFRTFAVRWRDIPQRPDCSCSDNKRTP